MDKERSAAKIKNTNVGVAVLCALAKRCDKSVKWCAEDSREITQGSGTYVFWEAKV